MVFGTARAVKSHRTGRRRKKGGSRLPVAPWIIFTVIGVLLASVLTAGFVTLMRTGCGANPYRVTVAASPSLKGTLEDLARDWERTNPKVGSECVGVTVTEVETDDASRGLTGTWDKKSLDDVPIAWATDSQAWLDWVSGSEVTADYFRSEPVTLGESKSVLAVAESKAESLGWTGGEPPSWSEVLDAIDAGDATLAAANPRTSTEGLVAMLNAAGDGEGGIDSAAMARYGEAIDTATVGEDIEALKQAYLESDAPAESGMVFTALDYQVEEFNEEAGLDEPLVPITPSGTQVNAVASYQVIDGASWVSGGDAEIASMFGDFLASNVAADAMEDANLGPVEDGAAPVSGEAVSNAVRAWQALRRDVNILFLIDRSEEGAGDAASAELETAISSVEQLASTSQAGFWEFGDGATEDNWREMVEPVELSDDNRSSLTSDLENLDGQELYPGGSPLFDAVADAYDFMGKNADEGSDNVVVVLTAGGEDTVSSPSIDDTVSTLSEAHAGLAVPVSVYTVGFGSPANVENLTQIAEATQGSYLEAPSEGGIVDQVRTLG